MEKFIKELRLDAVCDLLPVSCLKLRKWCFAFMPWVVLVIILYSFSN